MNRRLSNASFGPEWRPAPRWAVVAGLGPRRAERWAATVRGRRRLFDPLISALEAEARR